MRPHDFGVGELWLWFINTVFMCYPKHTQHTISALAWGLHELHFRPHFIALTAVLEERHWYC